MSNVRVWEQPVVIPTYPAGAPDKNPIFIDKRVYQGSSGKIYPNAFTDKVSDQITDVTYRGVFLENEYIHLMILPEIGGRIHIGQDRTNGYDFFYRQTVIKPALVGLLGPWISGGVEFNWPQHHRPTTFMPVDFTIEEAGDGSCTVWLSEHEPMNRMKGMVGICLHPGKSLVEAKVRVYNRTPLTQTFLWWANVAVRVHEHYQSFFPPDVHFVADHAKRAMSSFPIARNFYYGVDYTRGVDLTWYKNIPVPTSYMVTQSDYDFFGGYDHAQQAGFVHVANRHVAPGKKQWTWGSAEFGQAWDRELTDNDGPYIELMAGAYTDNQPDFSFLAPYETKTFSQHWYPIQQIGPAKNANERLAISVQPVADGWQIGLASSERLKGLTAVFTASGKEYRAEQIDVAPGSPFIKTFPVPASITEADLLLRVLDDQSAEIIRYKPKTAEQAQIPDAATEPAQPEDVESNEELYLIGLHLEQYRHATRHAETYWQEAIRRDPDDVRCNNALGLSALRRGKFADAEQHFQTAVRRLTRLNPNPNDGEPYYNLGLAQQYQAKHDQAYRSFYKATWNYAWHAPAYYALATLDCRAGHYRRALDHLNRSLETNADHLNARNLKIALLRRSGAVDEAQTFLMETLALDALNLGAQYERSLLLPSHESAAALRQYGVQTALDVAFDYAAAALWQEADSLLALFESYPIVFYARGYFAKEQQQIQEADRWFRAGREASPDYCFPSRLDELLVLEAALKHDDSDARAHYYLANLLYDKQRQEEAIEHWQRSTTLDPKFAIAWRNLAIGLFNVRHDVAGALHAYRQARQTNPSDARLLYEFDQLEKRTGRPAAERLKQLETEVALVLERDDLTAELVTLYNQTEQPERALAILGGRRFHPWEGGEGLVPRQYVTAHLLLGDQALAREAFADALTHFEAALQYPQNLGEGKHLLTPESHIYYRIGLAHHALENRDAAQHAWQMAAAHGGEADIFAFYAALAFKCLGQPQAAEQMLLRIEQEAERLSRTSAKVDYFATSLPDFLLFDDDVERRRRVDALFLKALPQAGAEDEQNAMKTLRQVLELDGNHLGAQVELRRLQSNRLKAVQA